MDANGNGSQKKLMKLITGVIGGGSAAMFFFLFTTFEVKSDAKEKYQRLAQSDIRIEQEIKDLKREIKTDLRNAFKDLKLDMNTNFNRLERQVKKSGG